MSRIGGSVKIVVRLGEDVFSKEYRGGISHSAAVYELEKLSEQIKRDLMHHHEALPSNNGIGGQIMTDANPNSGGKETMTTPYEERNTE